LLSDFAAFDLAALQDLGIRIADTELSGVQCDDLVILHRNDEKVEEDATLID